MGVNALRFSAGNARFEEHKCCNYYQKNKQKKNGLFPPDSVQADKQTLCLVLKWACQTPKIFRPIRDMGNQFLATFQSQCVLKVAIVQVAHLILLSLHCS